MNLTELTGVYIDYCLGYWQEIRKNYNLIKGERPPLEAFALSKFPGMCLRATGYTLKPKEILAMKNMHRIMTEDIDKLRYIFLQDEEYQIFLKNPFDMLRGLKHQYKYPPQDYFEFAEAVQTAEIFMLVANE